MKNPRYGDTTGTKIILDDDDGNFWTVASSTDCEISGRELFARAISGEFGTVQEYVRPVISFEMQLELCLDRRREAYTNEADGLFFGYQRGENTQEEWEAKIAEIKARFPKPTV